MVYDLEANVVATVRVLEMAASIGVPRLVFVSSGGTVYGAAHQIPIPESHPTEPICSYGIHKLALEKYLQLFRLQGRLDSVILRISNLYGESQDCTRPQGAVAHFVNRALEGAPIEIWGDGSAVRDYIYINDAVTALLQAASYAGTERLFNVGSGQGITLNRLTELLGQRLSRTIAVEYRPPRNCDVQANVLDISRAQRELSWAPSVPFEVGLERAVRAAEKRQTARV